jgi:hypothetical protein
MTGMAHHTQLYWGLANFLDRLESNCNPSDHLLSSWDYRCEPLCPAIFNFLIQYNLKTEGWTGIST